MCPFLTPELQIKIPSLLHMPSIEDESLNLEQYIQDFVLKRFLLYNFTPDMQIKEPNYDTLTKIDYGFVANIKEESVIMPLPNDKMY